MRIKNQLIVLTGMLALAFSTLTAAQSRAPIDVASLGPQVGELVPEFNLSDQNGQIQTLDSIKGPNGTMLLFHRSADW
jgi:hypothetical protein